MSDFFRVGNIIDERYEIIAQVGEGGMGGVFKARQLDLDRIIALKVLHPGLLADEDSRARFEREGKSLSELSHDNILFFYKFGFFNLMPYIAMEFLEGESLRELLDQNPEGLPWQRCVAICSSICGAMEYAHRLGVIHRDLKPNNIILLQDPSPDFVKIVDFGLARNLNAVETTAQHLTQTGALIGSVYYMSPEQCRGMKADARSDIYAVGCLLYEMLTGSPPLMADNPIGLMHKHVTETPVSAVKRAKQRIPAKLDLVIQKALAKEPEARYQTMQQFKVELEGLTGEPLSEDIPHRRYTRLHLVLLSTVSAALVGIAIAAMYAPLDVLVARFRCSQLSPNDAVKFRLNVAKEWATRQNYRAAVDLLSHQPEVYSPEAFESAVLRAELLQKNGNGASAVNEAKEALSMLAKHCRNLSAFSMLPSTVSPQVKTCLQILNQNNISFLAGHNFFRATHKNLYQESFSNRTPVGGKVDSALHTSLESLLRFAASRNDTVLQGAIYEFELPALTTCPDKVYSAAVSGFLSSRYYGENRALAESYRHKAIAMYKALGLKLEWLSVLSEYALDAARHHRRKDVNEAFMMADKLIPQVVPQAGAHEGYTHEDFWQRFTEQLNKLARAARSVNDPKNCEKYLTTTIDLTRDTLSTAHIHGTFSDKFELLIQQNRLKDADMLLKDVSTRTKFAGIAGMNRKMETELHDSLMPAVISIWTGDIARAKGDTSAAIADYKIALEVLDSDDHVEGPQFRGERPRWKVVTVRAITDTLLADPKKWSEIPNWCHRLVTHDVTEGTNPLLYADALVLCSSQLFQCNKFDLGQDYLEKCIALTRRLPETKSAVYAALITKSLVLKHNLDLNGCADALKDSLAFAEDDGAVRQANLYLGFTYLSKGEALMAERCLGLAGARNGDEIASAGLCICQRMKAGPGSPNQTLLVAPAEEDTACMLTREFANAFWKPLTVSAPATEQFLRLVETSSYSLSREFPLAFDFPLIMAQHPNKKAGMELALAMVSACKKGNRGNFVYEAVRDYITTRN